jgi:hypothetical protein
MLPNSNKAMPPFNKSKIIFILYLKLSTFLAILGLGGLPNFYFALGAPFSFEEADFHKMKGRETPSRSHNDFFFPET